MRPRSLHVPGKNRLLELLPHEERKRLLGTMEHVVAEHGHVLFKQDKPIAHVYFPLSGVVSLVLVLHSGKPVEYASIGNEGMAGLSLLHGVSRSCGDVFFQVPGEALRMSAASFEAEIMRKGAFKGILQRYAEAFFGLVAQSIACNNNHGVEQRLSRLILMSHDRVGSDTIHLTQEFLSQMLGVRRASVSPVAAVLQKDGLIRYKRGVIVVLKRRELETRSCECYRTACKDYERLVC